jgi:hypothetical protein
MLNPASLAGKKKGRPGSVFQVDLSAFVRKTTLPCFKSLFAHCAASVPFSGAA